MPITYQRAVLFEMRGKSGPISCPHLVDDELDLNLRPTPRGTLLVGDNGGYSNPAEHLQDPEEVGERLTDSEWIDTMSRLVRRFPSIEFVSEKRGVVGVYDVTPDWLPIYGSTDIPGYFLAVGTSGNQFKMAPIIGWILSRMIEDWADQRKSTTVFALPFTGRQVDMHQFAIGRNFGAGVGKRG